MLAACSGWAEDFGRFGYRSEWRLPALTVQRTGFRAIHPNAQELQFVPAPKTWSPVQTSSTGQTVVTAPMKDAPVVKLRADLFSLGFCAYIEGEFRLRSTSTSAPFLSWADGSVGSGVPTPEVRWAILSFRDEQPPIAIGFLGEPASLEVAGAGGDWTIGTRAAYKGWIRISAPNGIRPFRTNGADELGRLIRTCRPILPMLHAESPRLETSSLESDANGLTYHLGFDRAGAILPPSWLLAPLAGYYVKPSPEPAMTPIATDQGPVYVATAAEIAVRFPIRRVPLGRAVALGAIEPLPFGTISSMHVPGVAELSLALLLADVDPMAREAAQGAINEFFDDAEYSVEPITKQSVPYSASGEKLDSVAAMALLTQSVQNGDMQDLQTNGLLASIGWRRDWFTGLLEGVDAVRARRATALAAIAGALSPEAERRLDGALFQAGISGLDGLDIWRRRRGFEVPERSKIEPLYPIRARLFGLKLTRADGFVEALQSTLRLSGRRPVRLEPSPEGEAVRGIAEDGQPIPFTFLASYPLSFRTGTNVQEVRFEETFGSYKVTVVPKEAGTFTFFVDRPSWAPPLPKAVTSPTYSE